MKKKNILFFLLCFLLTSLSAQTLEQARGMYGRGQYAEAKPVFQKYAAAALPRQGIAPPSSCFDKDV